MPPVHFLPTMRRIAILISTDEGFKRGVLRGIKEFARLRPGWVLHRMSATPEALRFLREWRPHGVLVHAADPQLSQRLADLEVPMVAVLSSHPNCLRVVDIDNRAIGAMAARHLLAQQFQRFAFVGVKGARWSEARQAGYCETIAAAGKSVVVHYVRDRAEAQRVRRDAIPVDAHLTRWLFSLQSPCALFAANDMWGSAVAEACRCCGLRVPEEVAIVGADDDDLWCEMAQPELSSVAISWRRVGYEAAAGLERCLEGESSQNQLLLIPPVEVVVRQSSDMVAVSDPDLAAALRFIREHADEPIGVTDVLDAVPVERRRLERLFRSVVGRSPLMEICRVKVERAKLLLARTDWPMPQIARQCGISAKEFARIFRKTAGQTPTAYRAVTRGSGAQSPGAPQPMSVA